ncbi:alpha/beta hydrolase [Mycobacterium sp. NS-7484]|uniref:alpha/beta hydrolase n=1 Tax=Mycobacterium sp. NS-7484 TaxID=1834161 RepID=UPI00096EC231|nr:alpha/beta hydrolase [Mycobacterium sp. NS-7484]OMC03939.1 alpha/beta hydrolase [Mycobacterium sp. NS-7484]
MTSREPVWEPDVLPGFWQHTIDGGADPDGEGHLVATLVRHGAGGAKTGQSAGGAQSGHAVLALHGYTDYFFHTELAERFAERGFAFYALDLPKCGRSRQEGQTPHFTTDLARYDADLQRALTVIAADTGNATVCLYGHSAGGLILTLFADRLRRSGRLVEHRVGGLILNSPFFDLHGPAVLRMAPTSAALIALARWRKLSVIRKPTEGGYGTTLHRDYDGEFDYNLAWKPLGGFPITLGWINAVRRAQARLHRGLDVGVPNLILRSDHSVRETSDPAAMQRGDAVLDVRQIARWAGCVGNRSTVVPIADAKHDVFLSVPEARAVAYRELDHWLDHYLNTQRQSSTTPSG